MHRQIGPGRPDGGPTDVGDCCGKREGHVHVETVEQQRGKRDVGLRLGGLGILRGNRHGKAQVVLKVFAVLRVLGHELLARREGRRTGMQEVLVG